MTTMYMMINVQFNLEERTVTCKVKTRVEPLRYRNADPHKRNKVKRPNENELKKINALLEEIPEEIWQEVGSLHLLDKFFIVLEDRLDNYSREEGVVAEVDDFSDDGMEEVKEKTIRCKIPISIELSDSGYSFWDD